MTPDEIGLRYETDKSSSFHCYLDLYDECFQTIRNGKNQILEIGIFNGDSLKMFSDYFENSVITAFDILDKSQYQSERTKVLIGDQSDRNFLDSFHDGLF